MSGHGDSGDIGKTSAMLAMTGEDGEHSGGMVLLTEGDVTVLWWSAAKAAEETDAGGGGDKVGGVIGN